MVSELEAAKRPIAQKLYEKYKANGFEVIGVGEYDTVESMKTSLDTLKLLFPSFERQCRR